MQRFNWQDIANDEFAASVCDAVGINKVSTIGVVRNLLVYLFEVGGGVPITQSTLTDDACKQIAKGLLDDALREAFAADMVSYYSTGTTLEDSNDSSLIYQINIGDLVYINWCTESELSNLPEIGPAIAQRIVAERRNGAFKGGKDLSTRVSGIGEKSVNKILRRLRFARRPTVTSSPVDVYEILKRLVGRTGVSPEEGLRRILEYTITYLVDKTQMRWYADQQYDDNLPTTPHVCSQIGILRGAQYYYWLGEALDTAEKSIEMAMFHVAMPDEEHPTEILVRKLIAAKVRGVKVRILLDRDRKKDPYNSTVINTKAWDTLKAQGVDARFDLEDKLLHSKFLVLDSKIAIVGSHNWSAGSYFQYDDVTLVINSESFAQELGQRFDRLWATT